jgi:hypothetical protein
MDEANHLLKAEILSEYLDDDETKDWGPYMRAAIEALINKHYQLERDARLRDAKLVQEGAGAIQAMQANSNLATQGPVMMAQQQAQQAAQQQAAQQGMQQEAVGRAADEVAKEQDFSREQEAADRDHARQMQSAAVDHSRDREAATVDHQRELELKKYERTRRPGGK